MIIGIASGVYLNFPIDETIRRIAAAGYDSVDVWSGRPHVYRRDFNSLELKQLKQLIKERNLEISSFLPAFHRYPYRLCSPNGTIQQDSILYMKECMDNAVALGSPILLIVPGRSIHGQSIADAWNRLLESLNTICQYAQQYEIKLGVEFVNIHESDLVNSSKAAMRVIDELQYENLGIVIDTGHVNLGSETFRDAVRTTGDRLIQVHVNDNDGKQQQNLIPGDGNFDFDELVDVLNGIKYDGTITAELGYQYTLNPDIAARTTAQQLRNMLS